MQEKVKYAVVGCGGAGADHIKEISKIPEVEIAAICDIRPAVMVEIAKQFDVKNCYTDYSELFAKENIDVAAIITSPDMHFRVALEAFDRGIDVICEKPLTLEPKDSWTLVAKAKEKERLLAVNFNYHFAKDTRRMKEIIESGVLGDIEEIRYTILRGNEGEFKRHKTVEEQRFYDHLYTKSKGMIFDCGVHAFDLFCWFAQSAIKRIDARGKSCLGYPYPDTAVAVFEFENKIKAIYDYGRLPGFQFVENESINDAYFWIIVSGSKGSLVWKYSDGYANGEFVSTLRTYTESGVEKETLPLYSKERYLQHKQFVESTKSRKLIGFFPSPEEAAKETDIASKVVDICLQNTIF